MRPVTSFLSTYRFVCAKIAVYLPFILSIQYIRKSVTVCNEFVVHCITSVQSYHTKNYYAITMSSRPISTMYRHTISPICDQRGPTHSPKTAKKTPQTNRFSYPGSLGLWVVGGWIMASSHPPPCNIYWINHLEQIGSFSGPFETGTCGCSKHILADTI